MAKQLTTYEEVSLRLGILELPPEKVSVKPPKYRKFVCRVSGYLRGEWVVRAFKSQDAASRFMVTLTNVQWVDLS